MAWVSVHQQIRDHRKLRDLYRTLGVNRQEALGILVLLWTWAIDNVDNYGKLLSVTLEDICLAAYWTGDQNKLYTALRDTGWIDEIDGEMYLHDWYDFNKPFYDFREKKEKDKLRKREGLSTEIPRKVAGNSTESSGEFQASQPQSPSPAQSPKPSHSPAAKNSLPQLLNDENVKRIVQLFKDCSMGEINGIISESINDIADNYPMELVEEAFRLAGLKNARSISYPNKILQNWKAKGITTIEGAKAEQKEQPEAKNKGLNKKLDFNKFPQHEYSEGELDSLLFDIEKDYLKR